MKSPSPAESAVEADLAEALKELRALGGRDAGPAVLNAHDDSSVLDRGLDEDLRLRRRDLNRGCFTRLAITRSISRRSSSAIGAERARRVSTRICFTLARLS